MRDANSNCRARVYLRRLAVLMLLALMVADGRAEGQGPLIDHSLTMWEGGSGRSGFRLQVKSSEPSSARATVLLFREGELMACVPWRLRGDAASDAREVEFGLLVVSDEFIAESGVRLVVTDADSGDVMKNIRLPLADAVEAEAAGAGLEAPEWVPEQQQERWERSVELSMKLRQRMTVDMRRVSRREGLELLEERVDFCFERDEIFAKGDWDRQSTGWYTDRQVEQILRSMVSEAGLGLGFAFWLDEDADCMRSGDVNEYEGVFVEALEERDVFEVYRLMLFMPYFEGRLQRGPGSGVSPYYRGMARILEDRRAADFLESLWNHGTSAARAYALLGWATIDRQEFESKVRQVHAADREAQLEESLWLWDVVLDYPLQGLFEDIERIGSSDWRRVLDE